MTLQPSENTWLRASVILGYFRHFKSYLETIAIIGGFFQHKNYTEIIGAVSIVFPFLDTEYTKIWNTSIMNAMFIVFPPQKGFASDITIAWGTPN